MAEKSGEPNAEQPASPAESFNSDSLITRMAASAPLLIGSFSIDTAIQMHLVDCAQCRHAIENLKPRGIGQKTGLCAEYLHLQVLRADYEGAANNIVARTEYGDEAPKGRPLE